jgi:hypothetical protein
MEEIVDGDITWRFDDEFLRSRWTCIWGRGCLGILDVPADHLNEGCCSIGAEMSDEDEAMLISAMAAMLSSDEMQHHGAELFDETRTNTAIVDGACVFLNRTGFAGGAGCALHIGAINRDESPTEWKPSVCWQLPIRVDWDPDGDDREIATVRRWTRADWGDDGVDMYWCCTEGERAYVGDRPVIESLSDELEAITGVAVHVELRRRLLDS